MYNNTNTSGTAEAGGGFFARFFSFLPFFFLPKALGVLCNVGMVVAALLQHLTHRL